MIKKAYLILPFLILIQKRCKSEMKFIIQLHMIKESQNIFYVVKNAKISNIPKNFQNESKHKRKIKQNYILKVD